MMKKFSVEFYVFAPSDEGAPFREWALVECSDKDGIYKSLRNILVNKGFLQPGQYLQICKVIEEK